MKLISVIWYHVWILTPSSFSYSSSGLSMAVFGFCVFFYCGISSERWLMSVKVPDSKIHGVNMGLDWVLSAPDGPHVGTMNLAIRGVSDHWHLRCRLRSLSRLWKRKHQTLHYWHYWGKEQWRQLDKTWHIPSKDLNQSWPNLWICITKYQNVNVFIRDNFESAQGSIKTLWISHIW